MSYDEQTIAELRHKLAAERVARQLVELAHSELLGDKTQFWSGVGLGFWLGVLFTTLLFLVTQ